MGKLGLKEVFLGAALALQTQPAEAQTTKSDTIRCNDVGKSARQAVKEVLYGVEFGGHNIAFSPAYAAREAERECLAAHAQPKPQKTK